MAAVRACGGVGVIPPGGAVLGSSSTATPNRGATTTMADFQPGRQVVVDRLKRRMSSYRTEHNTGQHHIDANCEAVYETEQKRTHSLKQRHIEAKNKKNNTKKDKKLEPISNMGVSAYTIK